MVLSDLGALTLKFPKSMALVLLALTALTLTQLPKANVDGDLLRVYADSGDEYTTYKRLADTFGTFENDIYLLVTSPRLTDPGVLERMRELAARSQPQRIRCRYPLALRIAQAGRAGWHGTSSTRGSDRSDSHCGRHVGTCSRTIR